MRNKKNIIEYKIYSAKQIKKMQEKVSYLGIDSKYDAIKLLNIRLVSSILVFFVILYFLSFGYLLAPIIAFLVYVLFIPIVLDTKINEKRKVLEQDALYFFEVFALSLEAGRTIKTSLEITSRNIDSSLSLEIQKVLKDITLGKDLNSSLEDLRKRIPSDTVNNIILNIQQANTFGNDIVETMYNQIDYLREKRVLETKAIISKMPVKISIVSVIFFIPLLLLLLLGPMLIKLLS